MKSKYSLFFIFAFLLLYSTFLFSQPLMKVVDKLLSAHKSESVKISTSQKAYAYYGGTTIKECKPVSPGTYHVAKYQNWAFGNSKFFLIPGTGRSNTVAKDVEPIKPPQHKAATDTSAAPDNKGPSFREFDAKAFIEDNWQWIAVAIFILGIILFFVIKKKLSGRSGGGSDSSEPSEPAEPKNTKTVIEQVKRTNLIGLHFLTFVLVILLFRDIVILIPKVGPWVGLFIKEEHIQGYIIGVSTTLFAAGLMGGAQTHVFKILGSMILGIFLSCIYALTFPSLPYVDKIMSWFGLQVVSPDLYGITKFTISSSNTIVGCLAILEVYAIDIKTEVKQIYKTESGLSWGSMGMAIAMLVGIIIVIVRDITTYGAQFNLEGLLSSLTPESQDIIMGITIACSAAIFFMAYKESESRRNFHIVIFGIIFTIVVAIHLGLKDGITFVISENPESKVVDFINISLPTIMIACGCLLALLGVGVRTKEFKEVEES